MTYDKRKLVQLRESKFDNQGQASEAIGISQATLSRWETGESEPHPEYRAAYAKALGITVQELGKIIYLESVPVSTPSTDRHSRRGKG